MPSPSPTKNKDRKSDQSTSSLTPSRRSLYRGSAGPQGQSVSPKKRQAKTPLHIRMNLTETQMERITDAFTNKVNSSPGRARRRLEETPTKSTPQSQQGSSSRHKMTYSLSSSGDDDEESRVASTTFSDLMPRRQGDIFAASLAERRQQPPPAPIQVRDSRAAARTPHRAQLESVSHAVSPLSPPREGRQGGTGSGEVSPYHRSGQPESFYTRNTTSGSSDANVNGPVMDMYKAWAQRASPMEYPEPPPRVQSVAQRPRRSKSTSDGLVSDGLRFSEGPPPPLPIQNPARGSAVQSADSPPFSPLALYFRGNDFPSVKKGEKTMIGHNGWLERTGKALEKAKKAPQKKAGLLESIKKIAKDMTAEFSNPNRRSQSAAKEAGAAHVPISLNAREQSLLYCELEFHLTSALNDFITAELDKGHLVPDNLKKISDWWNGQGRPKVVGFRYDLETQLGLVGLHVNDFNFYGRRQSNPIEIAGLLDAMKTNARQIRVRTFCQPDPVIAKQLVDAQSLFNMINASNAQQAALAEIAQFFKVIVERERDYRERRVREVRKTRMPQPQRDTADSEWQQPHQAQQAQQQLQQQRERFDIDRAAYEARRAHGYEVVEDPLPYAR
ncbi:hypothetical protein TOPH_02598 [Tolypocladium ophioglossoides CBS 100239]|uniref:Uncharacterized protein n=1 Tax=Tolypocladium ophioglossoides (strain CBS 100239) TaxID=1163406 RepID=A0A0L0NFF7_TOLOC|nr:hypothetical protein TOPH_02598 [Tolypocladium ophioglossoides CBS 100239]